MTDRWHYENRVIAFVDILGFSSMLNKTRITNNKGELMDNEPFIQILISTFERIADLMGVDEAYEDAAPSRRVTQFSDSIVISFKLEEALKELRYLLEELLFLHIDLLKNGILIRGGISYGSLIHTEKVLFGPAMVHAYKVESLAANSPRIILPKSLHDKDTEFKRIISEENKRNSLDNLVSRDEDDFYYLDYFDKCQNPSLRFFTDDNEYIEHLVSMKAFIVQNLKTDDPGIYSKYGWMKSKWNKTILKYQNEDQQRSFFKAGRTGLAGYFKNESIIETSM